jgi:ABC-type branched-subunit amino acid transport system substrate-binding protein
MRDRRGQRRWMLVVATLVAACSSRAPVGAPGPAPARPVSADEAAADGRLVLGAVLATTGFLAAEESHVLANLRLAVSYRNATDTSGAPAIELRAADSASSITEAVQRTHELVDSGVDIVIVGCDVDVAATAARTARRGSRLAVTTCAIDDAFGSDVAGSLAFSFAPSARARAEALAALLAAQGTPQVVTVAELLPYERATECQLFDAAYRARGGAVVARVEARAVDDVDALVAMLARRPATGALVSCLGRNRVGAVLGSVGSETALYALGGADAPPWPSGNRNGVIFATSAPLWPPPSTLVTWSAAGAKSGPALLAFVALEVVTQAYTRAVEPSAEAVASTLRAGGFLTPLGTIDFDDRQRVKSLPVVFARSRGTSAENIG